ncbi:DUF3995 domain-containing protein [Paenibacillus sp. GD4]|jgi:hypothetical protein|uniref:DUF3995 domain-containing protein n=1 Tax=Paenibacillus sp. GD4 TaxID=3068890 RepID=UPI002796ABA3|nr:DUF3995 domain-containing protein [Paenibacillus sp. GD4]MDQ1911417.1 DUF3995 domain-containing protein [Paenibacillus sp. GD4]
MAVVFAWVVGIILFAVSGIHLYWMAGGRKGALAAIPSIGSEAVFRPTKIATGIVAGALAVAGLFVLQLGGAVPGLLVFPGWFMNYGGWTLALVFLIRAVGDFRWVGFMKQRRGSVFARWDTLLYSPLCLFLGLCLISIMLA